VKTRFGIALFSVFALATPGAAFAAGQPAKVRMPVKGEAQERAGIARAVHQGKGTGMSRKNVGTASSPARTRREEAAFSK
jgi:hypothetical protein